ncbi:PAC2 family protein [Microbacterium halophytorum]|uniref:PAC2 family protein n=1 Tax=Microbacterium halophytorum TaxID=2067568 RepID=UPI001E2BD985|nr:PAC2 family protein [Microbacterium halophytorum]
MTTSSEGTFGSRIVVAAFDGWNDAGEAASGAVEQLRQSGEYEPVFSVDPELYFDYQYTRPVLKTSADGSRRLDWPEATLFRPTTPSEGPELWLLAGVEPARAWKAFVAEFLDVALREDITGLVTLGSMMSDVPHTRPIAISATSENRAVREELALDSATYEGPVGILSVLQDAAESSGLPTASLWASVPHYVASQAPSPKATLALIERLELFTRAAVPHGSLPTEAAAWEASVDAAAAEDEEMREYIRLLEENCDAVDAPEASGDAIARAFEKYLNRDDRGKGDAKK